MLEIIFKIVFGIFALILLLFFGYLSFIGIFSIIRNLIVHHSIHISVNRVEEKSNEYSLKIKSYYKKHKPRTSLINKYCEAHLVIENNKISYFYVKYKSGRKSIGSYFEVKGDINHVSTMWGVYDMEFNESTDYENLKDLYYLLNESYDNLYEQIDDEYLPRYTSNSDIAIFSLDEQTNDAIDFNIVPQIQSEETKSNKPAEENIKETIEKIDERKVDL